MGELISTQLIGERISERTWDVLTDLMVNNIYEIHDCTLVSTE